MSLRIYNTLSRALEAFSPLETGHVRMYVCGMTVYDLCHLGHARSMVAFDVVQRWLRASGMQVTYVRNITDIDDKIIKRAVENGETIRSLTDRMIDALHQDADALGIERPTHEPRATDYVPQMLKMIGTLQAKGLAYQAGNGDVNFAVRKFPGYGKLSGKSLDELQAGERVAVQDGKADPFDFVLWKSSKPEEPSDVKWQSPFGEGRPGWHIECSAMGCEMLGESFDIHGGGADLQFPHHENEIAQSEGATGKPFAQTWMHNGFINVDNEKMSKSLGNFFTIRDVLKEYDAETVRFFVVRSHYRSPLNYSDVHLDDARNALKRLYTALSLVTPVAVQVDWFETHAARFKAAMDEDFARLKRWQCCLSWRVKSIARSRPQWLACSKRWAHAWVCCKTIRKNSCRLAQQALMLRLLRRRLLRALQPKLKRTGQKPIAFAKRCWSRALCSRIRLQEQRGRPLSNH